MLKTPKMLNNTKKSENAKNGQKMCNWLLSAVVAIAVAAAVVVAFLSVHTLKKNDCSEQKWLNRHMRAPSKRKRAYRLFSPF